MIILVDTELSNLEEMLCTFEKGIRSDVALESFRVNEGFAGGEESFGT